MSLVVVFLLFLTVYKYILIISFAKLNLIVKINVSTKKKNINENDVNDSQNEGYEYIINNLSKERVILLEGSAGTGKTTLPKSMWNYYGEIKN